jgi:DNA-binding IclR family transcriptional regulator
VAIASVGQGGFMARLANTQEYTQATANSVYVTMMYMGMLRRAPEQGGFDFWVSVMRGGQSGLGLVQAFLDAPEYKGRFLP